MPRVMYYIDPYVLHMSDSFSLSLFLHLHVYIYMQIYNLGCDRLLPTMQSLVFA